jgi:hypothetical protein
LGKNNLAHFQSKIMSAPKPGFKTKWYASGLNIDAKRRDDLYAQTFYLIKDYSIHQDIDQLADAILGVTRAPNEVHFIYASFDAILKKEYGSPIGARSVLSITLKSALQTKLQQP